MKNPVVHFEMPYKDAKRASEFYESAFNWKMQGTGPEMGNYIVAHTAETDENQMVKTPGTINGGLFPFEEGTPGRNIPSVVIQVEDMDEAIKKVEEAGGKIEGETQDIPGVGKWTAFSDTEGNRVSMLEPGRENE